MSYTWCCWSQGTPDIRLPQPCQQHGNLSFAAVLTKLLTGNSAPSSWKAFSFLLCHLWGSEVFENVCQPGERMKYVNWDRRFSCLLHCECWTCGALFMHIMIEVPSSGLWCFGTSVSEEHIGCILRIKVDVCVPVKWWYPPTYYVTYCCSTLRHDVYLYSCEHFKAYTFVLFFILFVAGWSFSE